MEIFTSVTLSPTISPYAATGTVTFYSGTYIDWLGYAQQP
jgi:hypothetical protein